jgi:hypothetical protein
MENFQGTKYSGHRMNCDDLTKFSSMASGGVFSNSLTRVLNSL